MRAVVVLLLLVSLAGCGDESAPVAAASATDGFCADLERASVDDVFTEVTPPADLTAAEAEGYRLLTEPGLGAPEGAQQEQAAAAFVSYLDEACPELMTGDPDLRTDPIGPNDPSSGSTSESSAGTQESGLDEGEFCAAWSELAETALGAGGGELGDQVAATQLWLAQADADGLADSLPLDVRAGFDILTALVGGLDPDTVTQRDLDRAERSMTVEEESRFETFGAWVDQNCGF